jgi:hypothetical protein
MSRSQLAGLFVACLVLQTGSGCALVFERNEQIRIEEPRNCVHFESESAASLFQSAFAERLRHRDPTRTASFGIVFVTWMSWTTTVAEAAFYNDEVATCDLNHDGLITEAEAAAYHRRVFPQESSNARPTSPEPLGEFLPAEPIPAVLGQPLP